MKRSALLLSPADVVDFDQWQARSRRIASRQGNLGGRIARKNEIEVDYSIFTPKDYLFSWSTAMAGVEVEDDNHTIVTPHNKLINDNGNAWTNEVLLESYSSFILAENYLEHCQIPELSKGKILDAVAWVYETQVNGYPEPVPTVFIDILVATSKKKHPKLCKNIMSGAINTMSMGCNITHFQCSRCGKIFEEDTDEPCTHIKNQLARPYTSDGKKRKVAELCGRPGDPGSCVFQECSWVLKPAFSWAKRHGFVDPIQESRGKRLRSFIPKSRFDEAAPE